MYKTSLYFQIVILFLCGLWCALFPLPALAISHLIARPTATLKLPFKDATTLTFIKEKPAVFNKQESTLYLFDPSDGSIQKLRLDLPPDLLPTVKDVSGLGNFVAVITDNDLMLLDNSGKFVRSISVGSNAQLRRIRCDTDSCILLSPKQNQIWTYRTGQAAVTEFTPGVIEPLSAPFDIAIDKKNEWFFISNIFSDSLTRVSQKNPEINGPVGSWGVWEGDMFFSKGIDWDDTHEWIWLVDSFYRVVQAFDSNGVFLGVLSQDTGVTYFDYPLLIRAWKNTLAVLSLFPPMLHIFDTTNIKKVSRQDAFSKKYDIRFNYIMDRFQQMHPEKKEEEKTTHVLVELYKKEVCIQCHDSSVQDSRYIWNATHHPMDIQKDKEKDWTFSKDLLFSQAGKIACGTCHVPHNMEVLDVASAKGVEVTRKIRPQDKEAAASFLRFSKKTLCLECHKDKLDHTRKHVLPASSKQGDQCYDCHHPHLSQDKHLTLKGIAAGELCISCHADTHVSGHPMREIDTPEDSKIPNCSKCHLMHITTPMLLATEHGMPGTGCLSCHSDKELVSGSAHHFSNAKHDSACLTCHDVHKASRDSFDLVGLKLNRETQSVTVDKTLKLTTPKDFCASCHGNNRINFHEEIALTDQTTLDEESIQTYLFNAKGEGIRTDKVGHISCRTCHDVHIPCDSHECEQDPKKANFLRNPTQVVQFCAACHGDESLVKFRYFHRKQSRKNPQIKRM